METQAVKGWKPASAGLLARTAERLRALPLWADRRGAAAVEFAFIAPILICMYFMSMEVSQAVETSKKVSRVGSTVADLITQQSTVTSDVVDSILKIGEAILQPYNRSKPLVIVTAIQISTDATPKVLVQWSRKLQNGSFSIGAAKGTATTVPDKLKVAGTFLIRVESNLAYSPVITWSADAKKGTGLAAAFDKINMGDTYYLRPRMSDSIACTTC